MEADKIKLSKRLKAIADEVKKSDIIADVGTDHAYIPIYLYLSNTVNKAFACDISKGSIDKANENIKKYECENYVITKLGYGLTVIDKDEKLDTIIISGMGGKLIIDILNESKTIVSNSENLILQPQRDINEVRKYIHEINFKIIKEKMLIDENKYYNIIVCKKGKDILYSETDYLFGKLLIDSKNSVLKNYIKYELNKAHKVKSFLNISNKNNSLKRLEEINKKINTYEEVLKCL